MKELYLIATNDSLPLDLRYDALRLMQHKRIKKVPFWKYSVLSKMEKRRKL